MRLIDADFAKDELDKYFSHIMWLEKKYKPRKVSIGAISTDVLNAIDDTPTADAKTVVHGKWIDNHVVVGTTICGTTLIRQYRCSVCGGLFGRQTDNYCYNCGAKMETEQ